MGVIKICTKCRIAYTSSSNVQKRCFNCRHTICNQCEESFLPKSGKYKTKYCSLSCRNLSYVGKKATNLTKRKQSKGVKTYWENNSKRISIDCKRCETTFTAPPSTSEKQFCSRKCFNTHGKTKIVCTSCGITKVIHKSSKRDKNYCSRKCSSLGKRKGKEQNQGRRSPEDLNFKNKILEKYKWLCLNCSSSKRLEVHHIKSVKNFPELRHTISNGLLLCHDCHYYGVHLGQPNYIHGKYCKVKNKKVVVLKENLRYLVHEK